MHNFYIVGTVRDVEGVVVSELENIQEIFSQFGNVKVFLVESDSSDETVRVLTKLHEVNPNVTFESLGNLENRMPNRYQRIAFCREHYLAKILETTDEIDFVVVADLDGMNFALTEEVVGKSLSRSSEWDAVFANQLGRYYDVGALRHDYWSPNDCFSVFNWARNITSEESARTLAIQSRMIKVEQSAGLIPVKSAYGGLAIYKREAFIAGSYMGQDDKNNHQLDFVNFNLRLSARGFRLFIDSQLINCALNSHNAGESLVFRTLRRLTRKLPSSTLKRKVKFVILKLLSR